MMLKQTKQVIAALRIGIVCLTVISPLWAQGKPDALGQAYKNYTGKKYAAATQELQEILKRTPDAVQAHEMLAGIYLSQNQIPQAIPELEAVVRLNPTDVAGFRDNLEVAYQQTGDYPKAIGLCQAALKQNPRDAALTSSYALVLEKAGRHAEAAAEASAAAALNPADSRAALYAGLLYHQIGNEAKAIPYLKSALALGTTEKFRAYTALAEAATAARQSAEAITDYTLAGQANPSDFSTQANLGVLQQNAGSKAEAEAAYRKALALKANLPKLKSDVKSNLGILLLSEGRMDEAAALLTQAGAEDPGNVLIQTSLGMVYEKLGRKDLALGAYNKVLLIQPENDLAKSGVLRLGR